METKPRILFVCSGPGVRGRIAEAFARQLASKHLDSCCARFEVSVSGSMPRVIRQLMEEVTLDFPDEYPPLVFDLHKGKERFDYVVTLCHASTYVVCPTFHGSIGTIFEQEAKRLSWSIPDFRSLGKLDAPVWMAAARQIRDQIRSEVEALVAQVVSEIV